MQPDFPITRDILLIGGGHCHALVLRQWGMKPMAGVRLRVINPSPIAPYTGMLPGAIAGHYTIDQIMIDLVRLCRFAGAEVILDRAVGLDPVAKTVALASGRSVAFDIASIDIGITSDLPQTEGFTDHGVSAKPLGGYAAKWEAFLQTAPEAPNLVIIGGGVGGVELALAQAYRMQQTGRRPTITVVDRNAQPLGNMGPKARAGMVDAMRRYGVDLHLNAHPVRILADAVELSDGTRLPSDFTLSVAGSRPQDWLQDTGLDLHQGFITVGPTLESSARDIFAVGDCAHLSHAPRPKSGVYAVREAPYLFHNLRARAAGAPLRRYQPQRDYLKLASLGDKRALAEKFGLRSGGAWLWWLKDNIDERFMAKFRDYPAMSAPKLPELRPRDLGAVMGAKPMCGGCGSKLPSGALGRALAVLPGADPDKTPGDDAAILRGPDGAQVLSTDHLRGFVSDPWLMGQLAAIHSLGDVWAMGAVPQLALAQIILPRASDVVGERFLADILDGAQSVFGPAGATLGGGHTTYGAEMVVGFTVTGTCAQPVPKRGAREGDVLILTKPLGTGIILAAEMQMIRPRSGLLGPIWRDCLASMARPMVADAAILTPVARAMSDVTGFGLAGHLCEMLGEGLTATLDHAALPVLDGAEGLAGQGVASTLAPANRAALRPEWHGPREDLLVDPQTCGGLLAAVSPAQADATLADLRAAGIPASIIGRVEGDPA
ncbi:selenide, water dikinase SelD [Roseibaca sp. V10]|uniref:Selenide, water dikinase SelD n=1 Tax=Roseinatronobacter domitianus TaxID=2940293 RepID=A0ABT0M088_9RHOB|nr:selenide, water dikinase SelD [Roseibaca domitiana]MCL1628271.1 selenide, water dikinase SelD [Roseibaca domitiana]